MTLFVFSYLYHFCQCHYETYTDGLYVLPQTEVMITVLSPKFDIFLSFVMTMYRSL